MAEYKDIKGQVIYKQVSLGLSFSSPDAAEALYVQEHCALGDTQTWNKQVSAYSCIVRNVGRYLFKCLIVEMMYTMEKRTYNKSYVKH